MEYHEKVIEEINQEPKKIFLNVGIIEAKELITKSAKTLSDPYCYIYLTSNSAATNNTNLNAKSKHRKTNSCDFNQKDKCKLTELSLINLPEDQNLNFCMFYELQF